MSSNDVPVAYGQIYVESEINQYADMGESFGGQENGLCGGAVGGRLFLITGMHTGVVAFTVELHDAAPLVDDDWEDVVEVSFHPEGATALQCWGGEGRWPLDLVETDFRVRYCSKGRDRAGGALRWAGEPEIDRYLLQFWPGPPQPDQVVRQTSDSAAYWHAFARKQPPSPSPAERAAAEHFSPAEREQAEEKKRLEATVRFWGGRLPDERIRRLRGRAVDAALLDIPLAEALAQADPVLQEAAARWLLRRTFVEAELADVTWIAPALSAMDRGEPLPPPFDDWQQVWDQVFSDDRVPKKTMVMPDGQLDDRRIRAAALRALLAYSAKDHDPLHLALRMFGEAAWALPAAVLSDEIRVAFPELATDNS